MLWESCQVCLRVQDPALQCFFCGKKAASCHRQQKRYLVLRKTKKKKRNQMFLDNLDSNCFTLECHQIRKARLGRKAARYGKSGQRATQARPRCHRLPLVMCVSNVSSLPSLISPTFFFPVMQCIIQGLLSKQNHPLHSGSEKDLQVRLSLCPAKHGFNPTH